MRRNKYAAFFLFAVVILLGVSISLPKELLVAHSSNGSTYVGAEQCGSCHSEQYESWNETDHANMAGIYEVNASGTFYWVAYPTRVMNEADFLARCASCHVTGWDAANQTWPEKNTDPGKFLNLQCEGCHGAGMEQPWGTASMITNYSASLCGSCHTQYGDYQISAHNNSITTLLGRSYASDTCLSCMSTQGFIGEDVTIDTPELESVSCAACHDPHSIENEYNLRFEKSTELCSSCHTGSHHPQGDFFEGGPHDEAGIECASCHGQGTRLYHGSESPWFNHTFSIYGTFYPFNQTEPLACGSCHTQSWATSRLGVIQDLTTELIANITLTLDNAKDSISVANQTSGVNQTTISEASELAETAESYIHLVEADSSNGFHNPEETYAVLGQAAHLANEAQLLAFEALSSEATSLETQVLSLQNQVTSLQTDVEALEAEIDDLKSTTSTSVYIYGGLGLAIGFLIGAAVLLAVRQGKP